MFLGVDGRSCVYAVWKFRAKKNPVAVQIHGNTRLEIGLTLAAALILVLIATVTFIKLPSDHQPAGLGRERSNAGAVGIADRAEPAERARS